MFPLKVHSLLLTVLCVLLAETEQAIPAPAHFYPYGPGEGDSMVPVSTPSSSGKSVVQLSQSFPCFGTVRNQMQVSISPLLFCSWHRPHGNTRLALHFSYSYSDKANRTTLSRMI